MKVLEIFESVRTPRSIANVLTNKASKTYSPDKRAVLNFLFGQGATNLTHSSKNWRLDGSLGDYQSGTFELDGTTFYYAFSIEFGMPLYVSDKPIKQDEGSIS